jgi:hypothetical protein
VPLIKRKNIGIVVLVFEVGVDVVEVVYSGIFHATLPWV